MEINYKDLFIQILTQEDIDELNTHVENLLSMSYKMEKDTQEILQALPVKFSRTVENYFTVTNQNRYDPIEFGNGLKGMIKMLDELDKAEIKVAIEPNYSLIQDISSWFYQNLNQKVILKFEVDRNLVAGMEINFKGKFKDYSYRNIFLDRLSQ